MKTEEQIGFIGLGTMGEPMALNLCRAGKPMMVWNRTPERTAPLREARAVVAADVGDVFEHCNTVLLMLENERATDAVLGRGTEAFARRVDGHCVVSMGTTSADYSFRLSQDVAIAGGCFVEAPVSGSRKPAETSQLVGMLAGPPEEIERLRPLLSPVCKQLFSCGAVPAALQMKLAVNTFLITMVTGLAEAAHFAARHGLDMGSFADILNAGPMASNVSRVKIDKLRNRDFSRQAGISDVLKNSRLVLEAARAVGTASPLMNVCEALFAETEAMGRHEDDMIAVVQAIEARTGRCVS